MIHKVVKNFSFFNKQISQKYGQKCCKYNQNGKPLAPEVVDKMFGTVSKFLEGWQLKQNHTRLVRYFYTEDYLMAVQFIKDIAKVDALSTKNCPSFSMEKGEVLTINVYSPALDGLSQVDFELSMAINRLKYEDYFLIPISDPNNYKKQIQAYRMKRQSEQIQAALQQDLKQTENIDKAQQN